MEGKSKRAKRLMTLLRAAAAAQGGAAKGSRTEARLNWQQRPETAWRGETGEERRGEEERRGRGPVLRAPERSYSRTLHTAL